MMTTTRRFLLPACAAAAVLAAFASCTGRTADNMQPTGETIEVVIPRGDVAIDSAVAAGDVEALTADSATAN